MDPRLRDHLFRKSYETLLHKSLLFGGGAVRHSVELDIRALVTREEEEEEALDDTSDTENGAPIDLGLDSL